MAVWSWVTRDICKEVAPSAELKKNMNKLVVLLSTEYLVNVWMAQCHQNPDFFPYLSHIILLVSPYAFASNLPMPCRVNSQMHFGEGTSAKAL